MGKYLRYVITNIEPLRIADDSASQKGQTMTLRYIPGSTIRGLVVNSLARDNDFEEIKKVLFSSKIRYLNAFPVKGEKELLPSPKGFYEDKTECEGKKYIQNLLIPEQGEKDGAYKRASMGKFCYWEDDCIRYYNVETASDMKIRIDSKTDVFRSEHIVANQRFIGYIAVEDEKLEERIKAIFEQQIILGNARSSGMGKCHVEECEYCSELPYKEYQLEQDTENSCYMLLLSNTVMRGENGEYCGLNLEVLQREMGVTELSVEKCSTSTVEIKGYNRCWKGRIPSVVMYEQGSVFRLSYSGCFMKEAMLRLMNKGIGIRRNEGFGRILFIKDYEKIQYKLAGEEKRIRNTGKNTDKTPEDEAVLKIAAKGYYKRILQNAMNQYMVKKPIDRKMVSNSQLGVLESFTTFYQYSPEEGIENIERYLKHELEKENNRNTHANKNSISNMSKFVDDVLKKDLEEFLGIQTTNRDEIMGIKKSQILNKQEIQKMKLQFITACIRYENKKEV